MANPASFIGLNICLTLSGDGGLLEGKVSQIDPQGRFLVLSGRVLRNGNPLAVRELQVDNGDITHLELAPDRSYVEPMPHTQHSQVTPVPPPQANPFPTGNQPQPQLQPQSIPKNLPQTAPGVYTQLQSSVRESQSPHHQQQHAPIDPAIINMAPYYTAEVSPSPHTSSAVPYNTLDGRTEHYQMSQAKNGLSPHKKSGRVRLPLNQFATSHSPNKGRGRGRGRGRQRDRDTDKTIGDAQEVEGEFDFVGNLNKFNKAAVFAEIEQEVCLDSDNLLVSHNRKKKNYEHYENILGNEGVDIGVYSTGLHSSNAFKSEYGVVIPYATCFQMTEIHDILQTMGFTRAQILETAASSVTSMVLKLLGGSRRINPKNTHQIPTVVVLAGPSNTGASSIATARHLSSHGVLVYLCTSEPPSQWSETFKNQFNLFLYTNGKHFDDISQMCSSLGDVAVDLVVDGICGIELDAAPSDLATELMDWAETCDANVISIDLPSGMNGDTGEYYDPSKIITPRWIVALGLPVGGLRSTECEARFLADIGIPAAAFENAGIDGYSVQTFGDKYVIPITLTNSNEQ